jgi:hypothetical protein
MALVASGSEHKSFVQGLGWVTAVSACAFSMSCAYVSGFEDSQKIEMISHFFTIDYILIAPQWIVPAADNLLGVVVLFCALIALWLRNPPKGKISSVYAPTDAPSLPGSQLVAIRFIRLRWMALFGLLAIGDAWIVLTFLYFDKEDKLLRFFRSIIPMLVAFMPMLICVVCIGMGHIRDTVWVHFRPIGFLHFLRNPFAGFNDHRWEHVAITKSRVGLLLVSVILGFLFYAFFLGLCYGPVIVKDRRREVDVVVQTTAFTKTHHSGTILFVLSQATLLLKG